MAQNYGKEYNEGPSGGCLAKDVHKEMRTEKVDIGGEYTTTEKLMRPQPEEPTDGSDQ